MSMYACPKSCIHQCFHMYVMHATCQTLYAHVSVSTKSMGLIGVECFLYIRYILLNILMIECQAVFYISEKNMLFTRSVLDFFFFLFFQGRIYLLQNWHEITVVAEEVEITSFFEVKETKETKSKSIFFLFFNVIY